MNAIIVDDELTVRDAIKTLISGHFPDIEILEATGTIEEGYQAITLHNPDLLFLDIELPDGTGFDLLKRVSPVTFKVIFITGHQEYALDAIKVSALDYILKPIDTDEFCRAVNKAQEVISHDEQLLKMQALNENLQSKKVLKRIILHTADHLQLVSVSDIIRAEADSNYTRFWLSEGQRVMVSRTLKEFAGLLSGSGFIRVHQSHLVNINYVDKFVKKGGGHLQLKDGTAIPVSPNLKKQVLKALTDHLYE